MVYFLTHSVFYEIRRFVSAAAGSYLAIIHRSDSTVVDRSTAYGIDIQH